MFGTEAEEEIKKVSFSNNTVGKYFSDISVNVEKTVYDKIEKKVKLSL
jgi:intein-encoded DNA endonuclease-like protein